MAVKIQFRRDLAANWGSSTVLASGEVGYETDTGNIKIGNGSTQWSALAYYQLPNVSVNPATIANLNDAAYRVMGRYRLNSVTGGSTFTNGPSDLDAADADSYCAMIVTSHAYSGLTTLIQQTLTQFSGNGTTLKQWVRMYDGTNYTAWTSTAHLSDNEVTFAKMQDIAGLSVIGKTGSGSGDPAEITAATSGHVLRYDGTNVAFGTLASTAFSASTDVPLNALADQAALSVVANGTNASAAPTAIAAGNDGHVLRRSGTAVGFGTIVNAGVDANAAIALSKLATIAANTVVGQTASGAPIALTSGSGGTARTALGLGTAAYNAAGDFVQVANIDDTLGVGAVILAESLLLNQGVPFTVNGVTWKLVLQTTNQVNQSGNTSNYMIKGGAATHIGGTWIALSSFFLSNVNSDWRQIWMLVRTA
jgi:hypothetical protein